MKIEMDKIHQRNHHCIQFIWAVCTIHAEACELHGNLTGNGGAYKYLGPNFEECIRDLLSAAFASKTMPNLIRQ